MAIEECEMCNGSGEVLVDEHGDVPCPDCIAVEVAEERENYEKTINQLRAELDKERERVKRAFLKGFQEGYEHDDDCKFDNVDSLWEYASTIFDSALSAGEGGEV